jgi:hypothetical protein
MSPRRNWDSPNPYLTSDSASVPLPTEPGGGGGGAHSPATGEKLSTLPTLYMSLSFIFLKGFMIFLWNYSAVHCFHFCMI